MTVAVNVNKCVVCGGYHTRLTVTQCSAMTEIVSVRLSAELNTRLNNVARDTGQHRATIIREAIAVHIATVYYPDDPTSMIDEDDLVSPA